MAGDSIIPTLNGIGLGLFSGIRLTGMILPTWTDRETSRMLSNSFDVTRGLGRRFYPSGSQRTRGPLMDNEFPVPLATTFCAMDPNWTVITSYEVATSRVTTRMTYILRVVSSSTWWSRFKRRMVHPGPAPSPYSYLTYTYSHPTLGDTSEQR